MKIDAPNNTGYNQGKIILPIIMSKFEITCLSSKGQIVIPGTIRKEMGINPGVKFIIITDGANLLLKPVQSLDIKKFEQLVKESRNLAEKIELKPSDINKVIKKVRDENRS
jgi:antitoxin PrlF